MLCCDSCNLLCPILDSGILPCCGGKGVLKGRWLFYKPLSLLHWARWLSVGACTDGSYSLVELDIRGIVYLDWVMSYSC